MANSKHTSVIVSELLIGFFAVMVVLHTILVALFGDLQPAVTDAGYLIREMISFRAGFTSLLLSVYFWFRLTNKKTALLLKSIALVSWVSFLEDFMLLENIFYMPELLSGKLVQFLRPIYLITIVYMVIEADRREKIL
ncbi:hypothetical protein OAX30_01780 [Pseudomonadales bacterium]|nr:hypothetical protein [Pseudomonadales bacterium]MDC3357037.1 hypothetical protein [Pseudomonadales bacterium]